MNAYLEVPGPKGEFGVCDVCKKRMKVEEGYLAIPPEWIELPQNRKRKESLLATARSQNGFIYDMTGPDIVCKDCAETYQPKLNLPMAKQDLEVWRKTGEVPLRANAGPQQTRKWWQFWQ